MTPFIIIPVFDEEATVAAVAAGARRHGPVLVIDDGSRDASGARAAQAGAEVIRHPRRLGKGQALRTGLAAARRRGATHAITLDGDGQHCPHDIAALLAEARRNPGAIIIGSRVAADGEAVGVSRGRLNAIRVAGFFINWVSGLRLRDTQSGFRVYPLALLDGLDTRHGGFVFETEILIAAAAAGAGVIEVTIDVAARAVRRSRFRPLGDGVAIGAYLTVGTAWRWSIEGRAALREIATVLSGERRRVRHAAMLEAGAVHGDTFAGWGAAISVVAAHRASAQIGEWWRHPRARRASAVAQAMVASPLLLAALMVETVAGRHAPDLVSPLVVRLYNQERLSRTPVTVPEPSR
jgi:hypothetical protein